MATNIEWTNETWNPIAGCSRVSEGCRHCYAETMAKRLAAMGVELNPAYFLDGCAYLKAAEQQKAMPTLFDLLPKSDEGVAA